MAYQFLQKVIAKRLLLRMKFLQFIKRCFRKVTANKILQFWNGRLTSRQLKKLFISCTKNKNSTEGKNFEMKKFLLALIITSLGFSANLEDKRTRSCKTCSTKKSYTPKRAYDGIGKVSKTTGRVKVKTTSGYYKPCKGKYVNTYARS